MTWTVAFDVDFRAEFAAFDAEARKTIAAYALALGSEGPQLGRPMADPLKGSKHASMKELRPTVNKVEWRVAYAFDVTRRATVLAAASKGGRSSALVYKQTIATADARFTRHRAKWFRPGPHNRPRIPVRNAAAEGRPGDDGGLQMTKDAQRGTIVPLTDILAEFSPGDQAEIQAHADLLVQESRTLAQFRRDMGMTQAELAQALETSQAYVAKLERNPSADMQVSTIARIASALGGKVRIVVSLPGRPDATFAMPAAGPRKKAARSRKSSATA